MTDGPPTAALTFDAEELLFLQAGLGSMVAQQFLDDEATEKLRKLAIRIEEARNSIAKPEGT